MTDLPPDAVPCISQNIYITGADDCTGKSVIMLALMEMLSGHAGDIGFFRPIIHSGPEPDPLIQLITARYPLGKNYTDLYGCTVPPRFDVYRAVSQQIHTIFAEFTDLIEPWRSGPQMTTACPSGPTL